jgi:hypothetical protein
MFAVAVSITAAGCGTHSPAPQSASVTSPSILPAAILPPPIQSRSVSGIVTDESDSPVANAQLVLYYNGTFSSARTSTDARGAYRIDFNSSATSFDGNQGITAAIEYTGGGEYENYYVKPVPYSQTEFVTNLRLHRPRYTNVGQPFVISIDADSSAAYDGDDWLNTMDWVWENFHLRITDAGILRLTVHPLSGDVIPRIAIVCIHEADRCEGSFVEPFPDPATKRRNVRANSVLEIRLAIPKGSAPQRYEVMTSIE